MSVLKFLDSSSLDRKARNFKTEGKTRGKEFAIIRGLSIRELKGKGRVTVSISVLTGKESILYPHPAPTPSLADHAPHAAPSSRVNVHFAVTTITVVEVLRMSSTQSAIYHANMLNMVAKRQRFTRVLDLNLLTSANGITYILEKLKTLSVELASTIDGMVEDEYEQSVSSGSKSQPCISEQRLEIFERLFWSKFSLAPSILKLQSALLSVEDFPVFLNGVFKNRSSYATVRNRHATIYPCLKVLFEKEEGELTLIDYSDDVQNVDPFLDFDAPEKYLWPKVCLSDTKGDDQTGSTDVVGMALPVQNINHSAFRSMFEKEKLSGNNFNEWFARLKLVLRVEKKMHVIEQPLPPAPEPVAEPNVVDQWTALYDAHTETRERIRRRKGSKLALLVLRGFRIERKLKQEAIYLYVGNGVRAQVEAIGSFDLVLPNGHVICLDNCHYAPTITRGVVSVSRLVDNGFVQCFTDCGISVSKNGVLYFNVVPRNGIYEIDMHDLVPNVNSIYNVSNKRVKHNLDSTYLWHCRLAHINKKRIKQLQQDGLLKSTDDESFDKCESCLSGKMTKKPFPHSNERAKDLLGIIHTDVCGPLRHVSRQGASYFITFTDDYSRYGYVYLLKHKHEVFETFKVFKNEVENQLGKTIKAIRSDRGGEYISQEFKDYLKANGIVQQLTPPYTPQHNGVSERRNRTLLDMVRSMMNLTTLPLSFWDYALESATRILNMVPTKKVDKTPYELWYGKVPNLSYLKVWGCEALVKRDTPDKLEQRSVKCIFIGYPKETMGYYFYFPPENKIVVARYAEFFEKRLISQEISGRAVDLEEIQEEEDTTPSEITSNIPQEVEGFEPPQEEVIPIRRSERPHRA
ncbi:retrotransposon protein, putative, ty1-copia subclass, partial [Tanacetum coccineum]